MSTLPPSTELFRYAIDLEQFAFEKAGEDPRLVSVALFVGKVREKLSLIRGLKALIEQHPRRSINCSTRIDIPRSTAYKFIADLGMSADAFRLAKSDEEIIVGSPILSKEVKTLIELHTEHCSPSTPQSMQDN